MDKCSKCNGTGINGGIHSVGIKYPCEFCDGMGEVDWIRKAFGRREIFKFDYNDCVECLNVKYKIQAQ